MAEVLAELVARITADATELKKALSESEKDITGLGKTTQKETKSIKERFLEVGKTATVMGAAITVAMGAMIKSFTKTGSELHDLSLKTGVSVEALAGLKYAAEQNGASLGTVEMAIRRTASALQDAKDGLAETKRAFDRMGLSLVELEGLKPEDQFLKIASAIAEIPDPMTRAATAQDLFGRSGMDMLPMLSEGADGLRRMMEEGVKLTGWTDEGAKSADALGDAFGALKTSTTGLFNAVGSLLAPALKNIADMLTGVIGSIVEWVNNNPALVKAISTATLAVGLFATGVGLASLAVKYLGTITNLYFGGILLIIGAVVTGVVLLIDWFNRAGIASKKLADENKAALEKQQADDKAYFANKRAGIQSTYDKAVQKIREEYGIYESTIKSKMDLARDASEEVKRGLDNELENARRIHSEKIDLLQREYDEKIRTLNAEADYQIASIQKQIDAINDLTKAEDKANRIAELESRISSAKTAEEKITAEQELARYLLLEGRETAKESLRAQIEDIRTHTENETTRLQTELEANKTQEDALLELTKGRLETASMLADFYLQQELKRLDAERLAREKLEADNLRFTLHRIGEEETALRNSYNTRLNETIKWVEDMNIVHANIQPVFITTIHRDIFESSGITINPQGGVGTMPYAPGFASGGIVTRPTLAMVGEAGAEAIIPLNEAGGLGGITINFTQPVFFDREDTMNKFVDMIRKGIQRQDRLRFGGAYNG